MFNNKNEKGPRSTSSESEREFYAPYYLECIKDHLSKEEIEYIYSLRVFSYSEKNADLIIQSAKLENYSRLLNVGILPPNFEDEDNEIGYFGVIKSKQNLCYIIILYKDERKPAFNLSLKRIEKILYNFEIERFIGRQLVYPI